MYITDTGHVIRYDRLYNIMLCDIVQAGERILQINTRLATGIIPLSADIITAARTGDYAGTARLLNRLLQRLQVEISKGYIGATTMTKITYSLETLLAMQQMNDWVAFADVLEYEFMPLWKNVTTPSD